ncbi:MAG TPA: hypothetical protein DEX36_01470 [Glutamicibacter sp.]|nr:hypothetical protein [Glutamicibacter sp.]
MEWCPARDWRPPANQVPRQTPSLAGFINPSVAKPTRPSSVGRHGMVPVWKESARAATPAVRGAA